MNPTEKFLKTRRNRLLAGILILFFLFLLASLIHLSMTLDKGFQLYGAASVWSQGQRGPNSPMPTALIGFIPALVTTAIQHPALLFSPVELISRLPDIPQTVQQGRAMVMPASTAGIYGGPTGPEKFRWLRENFQPIGHIAYSYFVYYVKPENLRRLDASAKPSF